jgi:ATP-binding cassette subfamily B protein
MMFNCFPFYRQLDSNDCGATALRIIAKYYGKNFSNEFLRNKCVTLKGGASLIDISNAAESIGFRTSYLKLSFDQLKKTPLPLIVYWGQRHYIVVHKIKKKIHVADPAVGLIKYSKDEFLRSWLNSKDNGEWQGIALLLEPTDALYSFEQKSPKSTSGISFFFNYLKPYKKYFFQIIFGMLIGSFMQLIVPFLTQALVDQGIGNKDINFIYLILFAQVSLLIGRTSVQFIRSWIMLHISARISVSLISDFILKLVSKPLSFFTKKSIGDIMQRIGDHGRIQSFITSSSLNVIFSIFNFIVFSAIILYYNSLIFITFIIGSIAYTLWVIYFYKRRRELDHKRFAQSAENKNSLYQLVSGIQDIKLENCEELKRQEWQSIQLNLFRVNINFLQLNQVQQVGALFINEFKNIAITVIAAKMVLDGSITFGMMLSIQYMIGMLNSPINQMIGLLRQYQDAKISLERLQEIHFDQHPVNSDKIDLISIDSLSSSSTIEFKNLSFSYLENQDSPTLENINLKIPLNKITAIVGSSGSGKTTLLKMILKFYQPNEGSILLDNLSLDMVDERSLRDLCGAVLQDGQIFKDSIAKNIGLKDGEVDMKKITEVADLANILKYINKLPLKFDSKIGLDGQGISQGQKQRILIARALYKNPQILLLDEATNALDNRNESIIVQNIVKAFNGKAIIIAAHRLSTIKIADQVVVMDNGKIAGIGSHEELLGSNELYYGLIRGQMAMS